MDMLLYDNYMYCITLAPRPCTPDKRLTMDGWYHIGRRAEMDAILLRLMSY